MILLLSNERDITTDYIVLELQRREIEFVRINSEHLAESSFWFRPAQNEWEYHLSQKLFRTRDVKAAYFRRPAQPIARKSVSRESDRTYCEQEWAAILRSLYAALHDKWLNSPANIAAAEDKPLQLALAHSVGLHVPDTVVTNDFEVARQFIEIGGTVAKPVRSALIESSADGEESVIFTNRVGLQTEILPDEMAAAPVILQREIVKAFDIRATVVGNRILAASIDSQGKDATTVDWRRGSYPDLPHLPHTLPDKIATKCIELVRLLKLRFAAIDLILDREGKYWFLEANPNGQWAWIENRTGLRISAAIVDALVQISEK